jgi:hypothetical protein
MEQTKIRQNLTNCVIVYRDFVLNNAIFFKRLFRNVLFNIALILGVGESIIIGAEAYNAAWGLNEQQIYVFIFRACACVAAVLFIMLIVFNFKILLMQEKIEYNYSHDKLKKENE